jgi:hypothetical protein
MGRVNALNWMSGVVAVATIALAGAAHAVDIYKWVDENGTTHYSDVKPAGTKAQRLPDIGISVIPGTRIGAEAARAAERVRANPARDVAQELAVQEQMQAQAAAQRRELLIQDCERNNGVECDREVDTQLRAEGIQEGRGVIRTVRPPVAVSPNAPATGSSSPTSPASALR